MKKNINSTNISSEDLKREDTKSLIPSPDENAHDSFSSRKSQTKYSPNPSRQSTPRPRRAQPQTSSSQSSASKPNKTPTPSSLSVPEIDYKNQSTLLNETPSLNESSISSSNEENKSKKDLWKKVCIIGGIGLGLFVVATGSWIITSTLLQNQNVKEISEENKIEKNIEILCDLLAVDEQKAQDYEKRLEELRKIDSPLKSNDKNLIDKIVNSTQLKANEYLDFGDYDSALQVINDSIDLLTNERFIEPLIELRDEIQFNSESFDSSTNSEDSSESSELFILEESQSDFSNENLYQEESINEEELFTSEYSLDNEDESISTYQSNKERRSRHIEGA